MYITNVNLALKVEKLRLIKLHSLQMQEATAQAVPFGLVSAHTSATLLMGVKPPSLKTEQKNRRNVTACTDYYDHR